MKKGKLVTILIVVAIIAFSYWALTSESGEVSAELAKCIGKNSQLYVLKGCTHCETQKKMFGTNYKFLEAIDCFYQRNECVEAGILATPTWIIQNEKYEGVQSVENLKQLTGCAEE